MDKSIGIAQTSRLMSRISKVSLLTGVCILIAYTAVTWLFFGSPHPCEIATRVLKAEAAEWSDEWWLDFARGLAVINLNLMNLEQSQKDKLAKEMWTAPAEVVHQYVDRDFDPEKITQKWLDDTRNDTPASCIEMLYRKALEGSRSFKK